MDLKTVKKFTYTINSIILLLVFGLAGFFVICKASFLIWFSIPTALVYIIGYFLIRKEKLDIYVRIVYFWLTLYMCVTTVCLGYRMGFHLYCLSMIPIIFYTEYLATKIGKKKVNAFAISAIVGSCYLFSTGYSAYIGPVYQVENHIAAMFWITNSAIVLFFIIAYSGMMLKMIGDYEKILTDAAHKDRLTALYNRHYMVERLEDSIKAEHPGFVAMVDVDDFKGINDRFGHNAGDHVLKTVAEIMNDTLKDCVISRWGGEEFLILSTGDAESLGFELLEKLRRNIEEHDFSFEDDEVRVTVTAGVAAYQNGYSVDKWVNEADDKLYYGKKNGKNKVILRIDE